MTGFEINVKVHIGIAVFSFVAHLLTFIVCEIVGGNKDSVYLLLLIDNKE